MNQTMKTKSILFYFFCLSLLAAGQLLAEDNKEDKRYVWELTIEGNQKISTDDILEAIGTSRSSHFPIIGKKYEFNPITLYSDQKRIEHLYQRSGYYQAKVVNTDVSPCKPEDLTRVCIKIQIAEGNPTVVNKIKMTVDEGPHNKTIQQNTLNHPAITSGDLLTHLGLNNGALFNHDVYMRGKTAIINYLEGLAFPVPKVEGEVVYDNKTNTVDINLDIKTGTAANIGSIKFQGLQNIRPDDLYARMPYKTGDRFNPQDFEEAKDLISSLDVFRSVEPKLRPRKDHPEIVDVVYELQEKPLKTLQFGGGVSIENSRQEARLRSEWSHHNFYNYMRRFSVSAEPRYAVLPSIFNPQQSGPLGTVEIALLHPAFLNPRQDLRTSVGFDSDLEQGYRWYGPHVGGQLTRTLSRTLTASGGYSFKYLRFYDVGVAESLANRLVPQELLFNKNYRLGFIDQRISWDRRNNKFSPTKGGYATLHLAESAPFIGSSFLYLRARPEYRHFFPLSRRSVLAARAEYGQIFSFGGRPSPITERFYGGGANDHRGFTYHRLSPQVSAVDARSVPVGGNVSVLFSVEQRYQLMQLADNWLLIGLFLDVGDVVESPDKLNFTSLHYAAGPGLRYETPVGVVRADVGFRLNRLSETNTDGRPNPDPGQRFAIHVSFGEAF